MPPSLHFNPSPETAAAVIAALSDAGRSFLDVASEFNVGPEALSAWMAHAEIAPRIDSVESACFRRGRLVAANLLHGVVVGCRRMLVEYLNEEEKLPVNPRDYKELEQRRRSRETTRKAMYLLIRLTRLHPSTSPPATPPADPFTPTDRALLEELASFRRAARPTASPATGPTTDNSAGPAPVPASTQPCTVPAAKALSAPAPAAPAPAPAPTAPSASSPPPGPVAPRASGPASLPSTAPISPAHLTLAALFTGLPNAPQEQVHARFRSILSPAASLRGGRIPTTPAHLAAHPLLLPLFHHFTRADITPYAGPAADSAPRFIVTLHSAMAPSATAMFTLRPSPTDPARWLIADIADWSPG